MSINYVVRGSSTQSRSTRPGKLFNSQWCSGVNEYDFTMRSILSWPMGQAGPLLGYPSTFNPHTVELVGKLTGLMRAGKASIGSYAPDCEEQLASMLADRYRPYLNTSQIGARFFQNGTDATQAAVALARHATNRRQIISVGYHGGSSPVFGFPPQNKGILGENWDAVKDVQFEDYPQWRNLVDLDAFGFLVAALVVEVPPVRDESKALRILKLMESDCIGLGIKFIMDGIVTGFRYGRAGELSYYNNMVPNGYQLRVDFVCLGKALSTYGKVSALLGDWNEMDALGTEVFASYTYNDHPLGFHDAVITLNKYDELDSLKGISNLYSHINLIGTQLKDGLNATFLKYGFEVECYGHPSRTTLESKEKPEVYWEFLSRLVDEHNILIHRPQFATYAHSEEHVENTIRAVGRTLTSMGYEAQ